VKVNLTMIPSLRDGIDKGQGACCGKECNKGQEAGKQRTGYKYSSTVLTGLKSEGPILD